MFPSNEPKDTAATRTPRIPKCARCRNHGLVVPQKGHVRQCDFTDCTCWKCALITERTKILAKQRKMRRDQKNDLARLEPRARPGAGPSAVTGEDVQPPDTSDLMSPDSGGAPEESGLEMGQRRIQMSDGKMYAVLQDARPAQGSPWATTTTTTTTLDPPERAPAGPSPEHLEGVGPIGNGHWSRTQDGHFAINHNPAHFHGFGMYSRDLLALPPMGLPLRFFVPYPRGYAPCPAVLVNMPIMPPMPPGPYKGGAHGPFLLSHAQLEPGAAPYPYPHPVPAAEQLGMMQRAQPVLPHPATEQRLDDQDQEGQGLEENNQALNLSSPSSHDTV